MPEGNVKWFSEKKGYGFIENEEGSDIFFHKNAIVDHGFFGVQKNERVNYEIETTPKGPQAVRIRVI